MWDFCDQTPGKKEKTAETREVFEICQRLQSLEARSWPLQLPALRCLLRQRLPQASSRSQARPCDRPQPVVTALRGVSGAKITAQISPVTSFEAAEIRYEQLHVQPASPRSAIAPANMKATVGDVYHLTHHACSQSHMLVVLYVDNSKKASRMQLKANLVRRLIQNNPV